MNWPTDFFISVYNSVLLYALAMVAYLGVTYFLDKIILTYASKFSKAKRNTLLKRYHVATKSINVLLIIALLIFSFIYKEYVVLIFMIVSFLQRNRMKYDMWVDGVIDKMTK